MIEIVWISVKVAAVASLMIAIPGILLGWLLARKNFPGRSLLHSILYLPMVLPPVVTGYVALVLFGREGPLGKWLYQWFGLSMAFTWFGAAFVSAIIAMPLLVRAVKVSVEMLDGRFEQASAVLGAGPVRTFFSITLPLAGPGILAGLILAFARSLGEFGATAMFAGNIPGRTQTLSLAIYSMTQMPNGQHQAMELVVLSIILSTAAVLGSDVLTRRMTAAGEHG